MMVQKIATEWALGVMIDKINMHRYLTACNVDLRWLIRIKKVESKI